MFIAKAKQIGEKVRMFYEESRDRTTVKAELHVARQVIRPRIRERVASRMTLLNRCREGMTIPMGSERQIVCILYRTVLNS